VVINRAREFQVNDILGKKIKILSGSNKFNINKTGIIVNETKNMIYLLQEKSDLEIKKIPKKEIGVYKVISQSGEYFINGKTLLGRPEEKISKIKWVIWLKILVYKLKFLKEPVQTKFVHSVDHSHLEAN